MEPDPNYFNSAPHLCLSLNHSSYVSACVGGVYILHFSLPVWGITTTTVGFWEGCTKKYRYCAHKMVIFCFFSALAQCACLNKTNLFMSRGENMLFFGGGGVIVLVLKNRLLGGIQVYCCGCAGTVNLERVG